MNSTKLELLNEHLRLENLLSKIPRERRIHYVQTSHGQYEIGKPRFRPPKYSFDINLLKQINSYFFQLKRYFLSKNYELGEKIDWISDPVKIRQSKTSPIFLLENDVWQTDAVYGDYFIEKIDGGVKIFYFRRNQRVDEVKFTNDSISSFIKLDARRQILNEFTRLWKIIEAEILVADHLHSFFLDEALSENILLELKMHRFLLESHPKAACLVLGSLVEMTCKLLLKRENLAPKNVEEVSLVKSIRLLKKADQISDSDENLLNRIRGENNQSKHSSYKISQKLINELWRGFEKFVHVEKVSENSF